LRNGPHGLKPILRLLRLAASRGAVGFAFVGCIVAGAGGWGKEKTGKWSVYFFAFVRGCCEEAAWAGKLPILQFGIDYG